MLLHKSLILLGVLFAVGNAVPLILIEESLAAPENFTEITEFETAEHTLDRRAKKKGSTAFKGLAHVWRADTRPFKDIIAADGFRPKGELKGRFDLSLFKHCTGAKKNGLGTGHDNDGYISTSSSFDFVEGWLSKELKGRGTIYKIATYPNLIDVEATLLKHSPYSYEKEFAGIHSITFDQIRGWIPYEKTKKGLVKGHYVHNKRYNKAKYDGKPHAGAQYNLAGFPNDHEAWGQDPWALYAYCRPHNARDLFTREDSLQSRALGTSLVARGRARKARPSRKKAPASRKHKTAKKIPKVSKPKAKIPAGKNKCTAAMKKAGKCSTTAPKTKCTAAMKKKGQCKDQKKGKCSPIKSNIEAYNEYVSLLKAGKPPAPGAKPKGGSKSGGKGATKKHGGRT